MTSTPSSAAEPAWPDDAVEVGRIGGAWGVKGWFKVQPFAADPQALFSSKRWFLREPDDARPARPGAAALPALLKIVEAKEHGDGVVARAQEVADRERASPSYMASSHYLWSVLRFNPASKTLVSSKKTIMKMTSITKRITTKSKMHSI